MAKLPCSYKITQILYIIICISTTLTFTPRSNNFQTYFDSIKVLNSTIRENDQSNNNNNREVQFQVYGRNIIKGLQIKATTNNAKKDALCGEDLSINAKISEIRVTEYRSAIYKLIVPDSVSENLYFCIYFNNSNNHEGTLTTMLHSVPFRWYHQGPNITIPLPPSIESRQVRSENANNKDIQVKGLRVEASSKEPELEEHGVPDLMADQLYLLRLFGENFIEDMQLTFTGEKGDYGDSCEFPAVKAFQIDKSSFQSDTVQVEISLPPLRDNYETYYICVKAGSDSSIPFIHQGSDYWNQVKTQTPLLPLWASIIIIIICLCFSCLFSGLNLGLMSLDRTDLKILCNTGTPLEKKYAKAILPVRSHGNYLLCSILLGNVLVNSMFTILLDGLTSGVIAVIFSTIAIVIFGEISPQAVCSRHGLAVGAKTIWVTKMVMLVTFPMAYPVSKILDWILGEEIGMVYTRERLKELVKTSGEHDLDKDEINIISGALELRKKTVADVMTKIEDVFMLDYEAVLDFETVSEIMKSGFSRVPVYENNRQNIVTMLYIKDLAFVDPDDNTPLKTLCQFYQNPCNFVFEDVTLDVMFRIFKEGNKGHMAFVHRVNNEGEGDPFYETIGLITLEDVIEELIQAEIMDETDVFTDNRSKRRRKAERRQDFSYFAEKRNETNKISISPQLTLAAFQFLSTSIEPFSNLSISETILKRLLKLDIVYQIKKSKDWRTDPACVIFQQGKAADYFILILEGRVEVNIGKENLTFEGGPFAFFGTQALVQTIGIAESPVGQVSTLGSLESINLDAMVRHTFQPDYDVRACTEVIYLKIKRSLYLAAKRATLMERSKRDISTENYDEEVDKFLHYLEDEDESTKPTPSRKSSKQVPNDVSHNTSSRTSPQFLNTSPSHITRQRDVNGSIKTSPNDEKDEEASLISHNS